MDQDTSTREGRTVQQIAKYGLVVLGIIILHLAVDPIFQLKYSGTGLSLQHCGAQRVQGLEPQSWTPQPDSDPVMPEAGMTIWHVVVELRNDAASTRSVGQDNFFLRSHGKDVAPMPYWTVTESTGPSGLLPVRKGALDVALEAKERLLLHLLFSLPEDETTPELHVTSSRPVGPLAKPVYGLIGAGWPEPMSVDLSNRGS